VTRRILAVVAIAAVVLLACGRVGPPVRSHRARPRPAPAVEPATPAPEAEPAPGVEQSLEEEGSFDEGEPETGETQP
jgi:hypothetical protein